MNHHALWPVRGDDEGTLITARVVDPTTPPSDPAEPGPQHAWIELHFVGPDEITALARPPFTHHAQAEAAVRDGELVFTTRTIVHAVQLRGR